MSATIQPCDWPRASHSGCWVSDIDLEALYRAEHRRIYMLALRMTRNAAAAEDILQESFVQAWTNRAMFRHECAPATWIHRIAVRCALRHIRGVGRYDRRFVPIGDHDDFIGAVQSAAPTTDIDLERAIASLPPRARMVFLLRQVEDYSTQDVAMHMGIALGTVKTQLHRARRLLMEYLTR
jgi:RNA polymerase sigma-70 factor, ECF subfamily